MIERLPGTIHHHNLQNPLLRPMRISQLARPKSSIHRQVYHSKGYRLTSAKQMKKNCSTVQINQQVYCNRKTLLSQKGPLNTYKFFKNSEEEKQKQRLIEMFVVGKNHLEKEKKVYVSELALLLGETSNFFKKLNKNIVQDIVERGKGELLKKNSTIQSEEFDKKLGFVLFGKGKIFNDDFTFNIERGDTVGEHNLFSHKVDYTVKFLKKGAILWVKLKDYNKIKEKSVGGGLRNEFNLLNTQMRLSYVKKKFPQQ